jgi:hypothetical protein
MNEMRAHARIGRRCGSEKVGGRCGPLEEVARAVRVAVAGSATRLTRRLFFVLLEFQAAGCNHGHERCGREGDPETKGFAKASV